MRFLIGEGFIANDACYLIASKNIYFGKSFRPKLKSLVDRQSGATNFAYQWMDLSTESF
ncbi:MAG: hypothetical protein ACEY3J_03770 [Arsenophonus sp.]